LLARFIVQRHAIGGLGGSLHRAAPCDRRSCWLASTCSAMRSAVSVARFDVQRHAIGGVRGSRHGAVPCDRRSWRVASRRSAMRSAASMGRRMQARGEASAE